MRYIIAILVIFLSFSSAKVILNDITEHYDDFDIAYYYDPTNQVEINQIPQQTFECIKNSFTYGYKEGTSWFKIVLKNNSQDNEFVLHFSEAIWKKFDLYTFENNQWEVIHNGLDVPLSQRKIQDLHPTFLLSIDSKETKTYYIKGKSVASHLGSFEIYSKETYFDPLRFTIVDVYLLFAFSLLSIFLLNLYSFILTREKIYIYYLSYVFMFIIFSSTHVGAYLLLGFEGWNAGVHVTGAFVVLTLLVFSDKFLHLQKHMPLIHKYFRISIFAFVIFIFLMTLYIPYVTLIFNIYSTIFFLVLFYAAFRIYLKGYPSAKYYLIALMIYTPLMALMILTFNTFVEYTFFSRHGFILGAFLEILLFTLILATKYKTLLSQKIKLQKQLLQEQERQKNILEEEIEKQTKEIKEVINKFEFAIDKALAGYWEVNLQNNQMTVSKGWYEFLGYTKEDIEKLDMEQIIDLIIHPDDKPKVVQAVTSYLEKKTKSYNEEFRVMKKDGSYCWIKAMGSIYKNKFFGFHIDINDIYHANLRLVEQTKMAEMGEMISNIAHQWRQPLSIISTAATGSIAEKEAGFLSDEKFIHYQNLINENAQYLSETIDTFRDFIKEKKEFKEVILQERIKIAINIVKASLENHYIKLFHNLDEVEPISIFLVVGELSQVIINILNNAKDALVEHQPDERWIKLLLEKRKKKVLITIEDNGGGIPKEVLTKIFEPYFTTKHQSLGTGLGLHMAYKIIVESLGGKIYAQNTSNGAMMVIELPLKTTKGENDD